MYCGDGFAVALHCGRRQLPQPLGSSLAREPGMEKIHVVGEFFAAEGLPRGRCDWPRCANLAVLTVREELLQQRESWQRRRQLLQP